MKRRRTLVPRVGTFADDAPTGRRTGRAALRVRRAALLVLALGVLAGCASTSEPATDRVVAPAPAPVTARALAASLDLDAPRESYGGGVYIAGGGGDRIALFPGTHVSTVRGIKYETTTRLDKRGDDVWLTEADAAVLRSMWNGGMRAGPSRSAATSFRGDPGTGLPERRLTLDDLPPAPEIRRAASAPRAVRPAVSAAERRAWGVHLRRNWQYIVVHHSATPGGNAASFDNAHRARGWDGLGYHFVIGNGNKASDGKIEVGFRWKAQREGAHAGNDLMNQRGIGICLVGDFDKARPTAAQMRSLRRLCDFLSAYCDIAPQNLRLHRDFRHTACPGRHFPREFALRPPAAIRGAAHAGHDHRPRPR